MNGCTIVARNYLGQATVLAESFLDHHPGGSFTTLVIDAEYGLPPGLAPALGVVGLEATGLNEREAHHMAMIYSVVEFATAVKPFFLRWLLQNGRDDVVYLDPDIQVFAPLDDIEEDARQYGVVLTPHLERPLPRDGALTDVETIVLHAGIFNLGFIAVGPRAMPLLDWWADRLARECVIDIANARFVDQRWLDLVPAYFEHKIKRDPTIDVAWWNLAIRDLQYSGGNYTVNGSPLRFFHFSGYSPERPFMLSTHAGSAPHVLLSERPVLQRICDEYAAELVRCGHETLNLQAYGFSATPGGLMIDDRMRRLYREALIESEKGSGEEPPDPFVLGQGGAFVDWLGHETGPAGAPVRIPRYLRRLHAERPDLIAAFPDIDGVDGPPFREWCETQGRIEEAIPYELVGEPSPLSTERSAPLEPGVQLAGYLAAEAGVGEAARRLLEALRHSGETVSVLTYDKTLSRQQHPVNVVEGQGNHDVNLICVNADQILGFNHDAGPAFREGRYAIGMWWWEVDRFPERFAASFGVVDEIWVGSQFVRDVIAESTEKPVYTVPVPVTVPRSLAGARRSLGLDDGFLFYFSFDFDSVFERKNPLGLIEAFVRAFAPGEDVRLLIRSINGHRHVLELERLRHAAAHHPDIVVRDGYLDAELKDGLLGECDCYISLHRSEGLGLTMLEAMALARPVIATSYSGNLEFMNDDNSLLVPVRELRRVGEGHSPYPSDARWAEPDLAAAAALMRRAVEDRVATEALGRRAQQDVLDRFSVQRAAHVMGEHLARIRSERTAVVESADQAPPEVSAVERARAWLSVGPSAPWLDGAGLLTRSARRGLLRFLRPYLFRRAEFDAALVEAHEEARQRTSQQRETLAHTQTAVADTQRWVRRLHHHLAEVREGLGERAALQERALRDTQLHIDQRLDQVQRGADERADAVQRGADERADAVRAEVDGLIASVVDRLALAEQATATIAAREAELRAALTCRPQLSDPDLLRTTDSAGRTAIGLRGKALGDRGYRGFEDVFRGSESFIAEKLHPYLDIINGHGPVLDVGCGRGEFLDLMLGAGISATGIDVDEGMVGRCRAKGHTVELIDAVEFLRGCPPGSYAAIFSAQVVEHFSESYLREFLALALKALKPGGTLIAETVNPHPIASFKAFWVDLTHTSPIFPEVAVVLCGLAGFAEARITFPEGTGDLDADLPRQGRYAVIAQAPGVPPVADDGH